MEKYVYISIIFFSMIIFLLYVYIMFEKISEAYRNNRIKKYSQEVEPYIDFILNEIKEGKGEVSAALDNVKEACTDRVKREVLEDKILHCFEKYDKESSQKLTELCRYTGIIQHEIKNLKNTNYFKKALAAKRLGEFRSSEAVQALLDEIKVRNNDVVYNILSALGKIGNETAFIKAFESIDPAVSLSERSLIEIVDDFEGDKNNIFRHMINSNNSFIACVFIKSAGNSKNASLSVEISKYLCNDNKELRIAAVKAIGSIADEKYIDDIIALLKDSEWEVRALAAKALNNFTDKKVLVPLRKALSDPQWHVRYNAATAILNHKEGMNMISSVFEGEDEFAKDIILSAIEHSSDDKTYLYEGSQILNKKEFVIKMRHNMEMENKRAVV